MIFKKFIRLIKCSKHSFNSSMEYLNPFLSFHDPEINNEFILEKEKKKVKNFLNKFLF